jgi:hypothetical protein
MPESSIESEFANKYAISNGVLCELAGCHERSDCDGQIERSAGLALICGCEINTELSWRERKSRIDDCGSHPFPAFTYGTYGQSDSGPLWKTFGRIDLDRDVVCIDA